MPQVSEGWIHCSQLEKLPPQSLGASEVEGFLDFLFQDVARRPKALLPKQTFGVVRYLSLLAQRGVPSAVLRQGEEELRKYHRSPKRERDLRARPAVERIAKALWGDLFLWGRVQPCTRDQALRFLRRHSATYLAGNLDLSPALQIIKDFGLPPLPPNASQPFQPPNFMSRRLAPQGKGNPRLPDDLSERIYAALRALKGANVEDAPQQIANALARSAVPRRREGSEWNHDTVEERAKAYEDRQRKDLRKAPGTAPLKERVREWRDGLVNKWIHRYRDSLGYPVLWEPVTRHVGWLCFDCNHVMPAVHDAAPPIHCASCKCQNVAVLTASLTRARRFKL